MLTSTRRLTPPLGSQKAAGGGGGAEDSEVDPADEAARMTSAAQTRRAQDDADPDLLRLEQELMEMAMQGIE